MMTAGDFEVPNKHNTSTVLIFLNPLPFMDIKVPPRSAGPLMGEIDEMMTGGR